ncbi:box C/D snoRNA protein 1 [Xenentodon cancila]
MNLLSDYRFLEDTGRFADGATRGDLIRAPRTTLKSKKMSSHARKMNITVRFLPVTFTKSKENSTFFLTQEKLFLWHLKLLFPQSSSEFSQRRVSDKQTLKQILSAYIHPTESDPVTRQKLKMYVHAPFGDVKVFMKAEGRKANSVRYHELDMEKSLRENLSFKTVIEYPVLHVALRDHWTDYPLKGPAESTCNTFATKNVWMDKGEECAGQGPASLQGSHTPEQSNICTRAQETPPETEPPLEKRAKRGAGQEEREEGEIDSSEDENCGESPQCDGAKSPTENMENVVDGIVNAAATAEVVSEDVACFSEDISASRGVAEVGVSEDAAVEELGPVCTRRCRDGYESADAADSCPIIC